MVFELGLILETVTCIPAFFSLSEACLELFFGMEYRIEYRMTTAFYSKRIVPDML